MKVLHITPTYLPAVRYGGPIFSVHGLCKGLVSNGIDVQVITTNVDGNSDSDVPIGEPIKIDNVTVWYFKADILRRLYWSSGMQKFLEKNVNQFDVLHTHSMFLWPTLATRRYAKIAGKPFVISPRGMLSEDLINAKNRSLKKLWIELFDAKTVRSAAGIHVTSTVEQQNVQKIVPNLAPTWLIPNGTDIPDSNLWRGSASNTLLYIGRINWKKGLDVAIKALVSLPQTDLIIAGNDDEDYVSKLVKLAIELNVSDRVTFLPPVYGKERTRLLQECGMFVLPSLNENFGNSALEAMAQGCPVVATETCGIAMEVPKGSIEVIKYSPQSLAHSVHRLMKTSGERELLSQNAYAASTSFSWDSISKSMLGKYEKLSERTEPG